MFRNTSYILLWLMKINTYTKIGTNLNFKALQHYFTELVSMGKDVGWVFPNENVSTLRPGVTDKKRHQ